MNKLEKREFKVGYRVWSLLFGWGNVVEIDSDTDDPIELEDSQPMIDWLIFIMVAPVYVIDAWKRRLDKWM